MNKLQQLSIVPESNLRQGLILLFFMLIMLVTRIVPVHHLVFTNWPGLEGNFVNFSADDAVYQMRLVHNTLQHFPHRIFFDPFTYFPYGTQVHFGPFFTLIIALVALIAGLGHPSPELINTIGAYTPAVMGALCLLPTYFLTRKIFNPTTAIFAAFVLALIPGEFFQRSALGFTDNHVAEVLFSTTTAAFLVYALIAAKNFDWQTKNWQALLFSQPLLLSYGAGIFFGIYVLCWAPSLFFGAIFFCFFITQLVINHFQNHDQKYLLYIAIPLYVIPALMVLPYSLANPHFDFIYYSLTQPVLLQLMLAGILISYGLARLLKATQLHNIFYPLALIALLLLFTTFAAYYMPAIHAIINSGFNLLFHPSTDFKTISELRSGIFDKAGKLTLIPLWANLFWTVRFSSIALLVLLYRIVRYTNPAEIFLVVWTIIILIATFSELRFVYYLAINAAILSGYFAYLVMSFLLNFNPQKQLPFLLQKYALIIFTLFFTLVVTAPILSLLLDKHIQSGPHLTKEWYDSLIWLRTQTPDPQGNPISPNFDYVKGLYPIPKVAHSRYPYPPSAYGVMTWWDYGHQITYVAHRIPNANPFQQGVVEENKAGAAHFLTTTSEAMAVKNLDFMGSRYVILNAEIPSNFFENIAIWAEDNSGWKNYVKFNHIAPLIENKLFVIDSPKFSASMTSKLFYADCNNLSHFRLIYESPGKYSLLIRTLNTKIANQESNQAVAIMFDKYEQALAIYQQAQHTFWINKEKTLMAYAARFPTKGIKIFEKVKGANIYGYAPTGKKITISLKLKTKDGRIFDYTNSTVASDNHFTLIVPYPTEEMQGIGYKYDIFPLGKYSLEIGGKNKDIAVTEQAVMQGETIAIN